MLIAPRGAGRQRGWRRLVRRLRDIVLLPLALLVVVLEDVLWAGAKLALRWITALPPVRRLEAWLATLPGWLALPLFLVPEALGKLGELWALALMAQGHVRSGVLAYLAVRVVASLVVVFIYHACEASLLRVHWFAYAVGIVHRIRDWSVAKIRPWRTVIRAFLQRRRSRLMARLWAIRFWVRQRIGFRND